MAFIRSQSNFAQENLTSDEETLPDFEEVIVKSEDEIDDPPTPLDVNRRGIK